MTTMTATAARTEREIASMGFDVEVLLVWRRSGQIEDEARGFKRWERSRSRRLGDRGVDYVQLYAYDGRHWQPVAKSHWPTHFVQDGPTVPAPQIPRPALEGPPPAVEDAHGEIWRRIVRALEVDKALGDREAGWLKVGSWWPATRPGPGDYPPEAVTRDRPKPSEVTDYLVVMPWLARLEREDTARGVEPRERHLRVLRLRAYGLSFRSVGDKIGRSEDTARKRWGDALRLVAGFAAADGAEGAEKGARRVGGGRRRGHR
jgi:hypothetical protein